MIEIKLQINKITVLQREYHPDLVFIDTTLPTPILSSPEGFLSLRAEVSKDYGEEYVKNVFGITPTIIKNG